MSFELRNLYSFFSVVFATQSHILAMSWLPSLRRSLPSIRRIASIQRLQSRQLHTPSPSPISGSSFESNRHENSALPSLRRWISGIGVGSGLGILYWFSSYSSSTESDSGFFNRPILSFADYSSTARSEATEHDRRSSSFIHKLSLPESASKFLLFGGERKVFFNYEKRIRLRSPPEKVFEYFASVRTVEGELIMRPADLMRAVVPVFPPSESNLVRDGYLIGERSPGDLRCDPSQLLMLFDVDNDGHISFKEEIDKEEFKKVMTLMRAQNRQGAHHRDGLRFGIKVNGSVENGGLVEYFFGKEGKERLKIEKFVKFMRDLHDEILRLEFAHYDYKLRGTISAKDFALSMVASADMSHLSRLLGQVDKLTNEPHLKDVRITLEEFKSFAELRKKLQPFSLALFSYGEVNGQLTREDFQRAASHVCGVDLSSIVVEIIFHLFDVNCDGSLSLDEFVRVLHGRERDISQPVGSGVMGFLFCCVNCTYNNSTSDSLRP
ncbi:hypothetical protein TIFTF001_014671 [Ficus carica]|uniref:EF-hand domain-containing protein n=1 Tax=Ficus carica TaxID=3494 RepID=A0AA88D8D5_FICCA|nr:hypothetical protein TIFTF001_014671 [Ficus carica]